MNKTLKNKRKKRLQLTQLQVKIIVIYAFFRACKFRFDSSSKLHDEFDNLKNFWRANKI